MSYGFDILYEEGPVLVVSKPSGLLTQAPPSIDSLEMRIRKLLAERDPQNERIYLGLPHRLDRPASGAMVFALSLRAARNISKQFERRKIGKTYWALVEGRVDPPEGTWTDMLWKVHGQPRSVVVEPSDERGQIAILHYRTRGLHPLGTWLEIELETGRTHQIRIQAASRGHAVLGDSYYGSQIPFGTQHEDLRMRAIALHARTLSLEHPLSKLPVSITAPVSEAWNDVIGSPT
jgi:23S rRNA pseudouridine1911/1915/1917 synthase